MEREFWIFYSLWKNIKKLFENSWEKSLLQKMQNHCEHTKRNVFVFWVLVNIEGALPERSTKLDKLCYIFFIFTYRTNGYQILFYFLSNLLHEVEGNVLLNTSQQLLFQFIY